MTGASGEKELVQLLWQAKEDSLMTWRRQRTSDELGSLVTRRLDALLDVEL